MTVEQYKALYRRLQQWEDRERDRPVVVTVLETGRLLQLRRDVPRTRAECPKSRPCPHVRCENHLWMIDGRDRPGRRHPDRDLPASELRPAWLEVPTPASCFADIIEAEAIHKWTIEQKAKVLGLSVDTYQWTLRNVAKKMRGLIASGNFALLEFMGG